MAKKDTTFFGWVSTVIAKCITLAISVGAGMVFLATVNNNGVVAIVAGGIAFISFCSLFVSADE